MHNADDVINPCSNSDSDSDSDMPLCQVDGIDSNPTTHQTYNAMVADLVAAFDDAKPQHDKPYLGDSDTPVSDANDTITDASANLVHGTTDSDGTSTDGKLDEAHPVMEITITNDHNHCKINMMHSLTISSSPQNNPSIHRSYSNVLATWRTHVTTPFPLIIQRNTIARTRRSREVQPTHVLAYDIDIIQGDGNCFFYTISKEIFVTKLNHFHLQSIIIGHIGVSDALRSSLYVVSAFDNKDNFKRDVAEMQKDGTWASTWVIFATATFLQTPIDTYTLVGHEWAWCMHNPFPPSPT